MCCGFRKCWPIGFFAALAYLAVVVESKASDRTIENGEFIDSEALEAIHEAVNSASDNSFLPLIPHTDEFWYPRDGNYGGGDKIKRIPSQKRYEKRPIHRSDTRLVKKHVKYTQMTEMIETILNHLLVALLVLPPFVLLYIMIPLKLLLGLKMNVLANAFAMGAMSGYMLKKKHHSDGGGGTSLQQLQSFVISSGFPFWFPILLNSAGFFGGVGHTASVDKLQVKEEEMKEEQVKEEQVKGDTLDKSDNDIYSYEDNISEESGEPSDNQRWTAIKERRFKMKNLAVFRRVPWIYNHTLYENFVA